MNIKNVWTFECCFDILKSIEDQSRKEKDGSSSEGNCCDESR